ncbi:Kelch repeat-containing protein [Heterostelium album PN500]|uniref:Kelch repeat-containing protein n=1 Tax=Heterostelium pallidum (strain ATCC 26659 / Pp 5 / PN500) TaxID=670386 RepID=D3B340_HETP5|nr:Kelch repeat-containing protein [Heterostelium album PN500]EFA83738.1 Kelch repeat-containing protein [Heterostelium album PN500]|eukprot:XP_020435855.1 Kelch repeat-containing protein [Heterostelium album PN500]
MATLTPASEKNLISYLHLIYLRDRKAVVYMVGTHLDECPKKSTAEKTIDRLALHFRQSFPTLHIAIHCQFIRLEPGAAPMKTEMIALNPVWTAKAIASLVGFQPHALPFNVNLESDEEDCVPGILSHRVLRYVWNPNAPYHVPERFFSLFLSLLESNDLAINIYTIIESDSIRDRHMSSAGMIKFTANLRVRNGRSSSFNARLGWALIASLLPMPPSPLPVPFATDPIWAAYPERPEIQQFTRRYVLDFTPHGLFGRLLSRLMQICHLLKCWHNIAILVPSSGDERILVTLDPNTNTIEIVSRFSTTSLLSYHIYDITESLISKWYKLSYRALVLCSHCVSNRIATPHLFRVEECEASVMRGDKLVYCQQHRFNSSSSGSDLSKSVPRPLTRKDSKTTVQLQPEALRRDSKGSSSMVSMSFERKESTSSLSSSTSSISTDTTIPIDVNTLLLDHSILLERVKEIDFRDIEVMHDNNVHHFDNSVQSIFTSLSMGMLDGKFVNIKIFNTPSENYGSYTKVLSMFRHEVLSMTAFRHPNVLELIGITLNPLAIITENPTFANKASTFLSEYIQDRQKHPEIAWRLKLKIALDIAKAMDKLQSQLPPFLITNLSSSNIILEKSQEVEEGIIAKISDLSSVSILPALFPTDTSPKSWHAPEILQKVNYHESTDVYSYGIILYELLTRSIAFQDHERFSSMVINGQRPSIPPDCLPSFGDLIKDCWSGDPLNRPCFSDIISQLTQIKMELEGKDNNYNSLSSDTNIYSKLPLPSGGTIIYNDRLYQFGGWAQNGKPHSNLYVLNLSNMVLEEKLSVVLKNKHAPTYKTFFAHMQSEFNEENLLYYEAIRAFRALPMSTPDERELVRLNARKIHQAFIDDSAPRQINLPGTLKIELRKTIIESAGYSANPSGADNTSNITPGAFNDTIPYVLSSIEDSFHRFKFSSSNSTRNGNWTLIQCRGLTPPPTVGPATLLWNKYMVVFGGWNQNARQLNQIYLLNLDSFEWTLQNTTGEIPPSSSAALSTTLHGDYLLVYYERADSPKQQIYRLSLESLIWISLRLD